MGKVAVLQVKLVILEGVAQSSLVLEVFLKDVSQGIGGRLQSRLMPQG